MKVFCLPDLGEGLHEAQIIEWKVNKGDFVLEDQVLVTVETDKATVDIPSPFKAKVHKLYGEVNQIIETGKPLISFELEEDQINISESQTVVGKMEVKNDLLEESVITKNNYKSELNSNIKIIPAARALAKKLNIDLFKVKASGPNNTILFEDVKLYSEKKKNLKQLSRVGRSMALNMTKIHQNIVPVTIVEDADLYLWAQGNNIMLRIIRSIINAIKEEPSLNVHYNHEELSIQHYDEIHLGIAVDSPYGLYVPVIKNVEELSQKQIKEYINDFKIKASNKSFSKNDLKNPTIILSNYGSIIGRYATPVVVPPTVAMIGLGRARKEVVVYENKIAIHRILPLSLTIDHRALTGGEAARFLKILITDLEKEN